jgi:hypothetical protein
MLPFIGSDYLSIVLFEAKTPDLSKKVKYFKISPDSGKCCYVNGPTVGHAYDGDSARQMAKIPVCAITLTYVLSTGSY